MSFYGQYTGFGGGGGPVPTFLSMITGASLTTDLELCLDAADGNSYTSGQDWVDVSGSSNADEFFRGSGTGSDGADPTFNGTVDGRSLNEYWSFDGGDDFEYGAANETWMKNMHKDNADWSTLCAFYHPASVGASGLWGTSAGGGGVGTGTIYEIRTDDTMGWRVGPHNGTDAWVRDPIYTDDGLNEDAWNIIGISIDEATGSGGGFFYLNGAYNQTGSADTFDATYFSDSGIIARQTDDATDRLHIGSCADLDPAAASGSRLGVIAFWSTALSKANFDSIYTQLATRYGL